ncbi:hypothetical protein HZA97_09085 [Candidatus Woesearchaeota archaeon]|nr:hypothetical protein [Candidatus Woesearchaeota archaeon]
MHKCPTCDRELEELKDFPLVQIISFERLDVHSDLVFPYHDRTSYVADKKEESKFYNLEGYKEAPKQVVDFFDKKEQEKGFFRKLKEALFGNYQPLVPKNNQSEKNEFNHEGWIWTEENYFGEPGQFRRYNPNQRTLILDKVNTYLSRLESLVGKEVPSSEVLPKFKNDSYFKFAFEIPETPYLLSVHDEKEQTSDKERIAIVHIYGEGPNLGSAGGPTIGSLAQVARITYQGKFKQ